MKKHRPTGSVFDGNKMKRRQRHSVISWIWRLIRLPLSKNNSRNWKTERAGK